MTKQLKRQYKDDVDQYQHRHQEQQHYVDYLQKRQAEMENMQPPQMQQMPPAPEEQKGLVTQRIFQVLAIAGIAFSLFGHKRNGFAQGALMSGMGSLIKGYLQGQQEKHKQDVEQWHLHNQSIMNDNKERMNGYNQIMDNKRLRMADQMELFKMRGEFYKDGRMQQNAIKGDLAKIHQHLEHMKKWQDTHNLNTPMSKADAEMYNGLIQEKSGGKYDMSTPEGRAWAAENYPRSQFYNEKKSRVKQDKDTEKKSGGYTGKEPPADEKKSPTPDERKSDLDKHMDAIYGGTGDTKTDTKTNESVLAPSNSSVLTTNTDGQGNQSGL
jgi:hypothetical protein